MTTSTQENGLKGKNLAPQDGGNRSSNDQAIHQNPRSTTDNELIQAKLQKLRDYLQDSLAQPIAEVAMLGATNAELMKLATALSDSIEKLLQDNSSSTTQFELLMRGIETMLRLTRQIDRFTQLRMIISEAHSALEGSTHSRKYVR